jgi:hypothetical protein
MSLPTKPKRGYLFCGECKWWEDTQSNEGMCRRHAPRPLVVEETESCAYRSEARFPITIKWDFCAEAEWNQKNLENDDG